MSERKVLNKYYPPDFDPTKIPKLRRPKNYKKGVFSIRLMAPFNMKCNTCGEYIYKGKKFNSRKETVENENYLGLHIFRFYIKCPRCIAEIAFKTDPATTDYELEAGATRNFEATRTAEKMALQEQKEKEAEEANNPMKVLENRTKASCQEMAMIETLEDLRELRHRHARVDTEQMLQQNKDEAARMLQQQEDEDEEFVKSIFGKDGTGIVLKRIDSENDSADSSGSSDDDSTRENANQRSTEPPAKIARITSVSKPTDVLTEDTSAGSTSHPSKEMAVSATWNRSVGTMKCQLAGLVRPKTTPQTVTVPTSVADSTGQLNVTAVGCSSVTDSSEAATSSAAKQTAIAPVTSTGLAGLGAYSSSGSDSENECNFHHRS